MSLDGFSLSPLILELNAKLAGGRIEKIFQTDKYTLVLWVRQGNENFRLLISANPTHPRIHLTEAAPENPAVPPAFCMLLRKHLEDGRIAQICQHGLDRIALLYVDIRGERGAIVTKCLITELMGKHSNIIFTQNDLVIDAIKRVSLAISRYRQVLPNKEYIYPPEQERLNLLSVSAVEFIRSMADNHTGLLAKSIMNTGTGIGPVTAREVVWRTGLPSGITVESLDQADQAALCNTVQSLVEPLAAGIINPTVVVDDTGRLSGIAAFKLEHLSQHVAHYFCSMSQAVEFASQLTRLHRIPERELLLKLVAVEQNRLSRKHSALSQELLEANSAGDLRNLADILMTNLYSIPQGASQATLTDIYRESSVEEQIVIELDPRLSVLENAQAYYAKYNKRKRAQDLLAEQLIQCTQEMAYLDSIEVALEHAITAAEVADVQQELVASGYSKQSGKKRPAIKLTAPLTVVTEDGLTILVGKNNRQNDIVTFKQARADDIWLHTKDIPGSHVILRTGQQEPSDVALATAAHLAAYFSKARQSSSVPVDYTRRRYVKKPAGAKPGFVIYDHQNTLQVTPDETRIKTLLKI
jgi:predicted ribosome quality control (RQC) complex YloA/Tae2 family protein